MSSKIKYWTKLLTKFLSVQVLVQALGFVSGIVLIRSLSKEEYGYLTIANSMQSMMNGLADSGISIGISEIAGKVWNDKYRFGQVIQSALELRKWLALISTSIITPIMIWVLLRNNISTTSAILITIAILIELYFYLESSVLETVPRFYSKIKTIQNLDIVFAVTRLILLGVGYFTFLNSVIAAFISTIASACRTILLRRVANQEIDVKVEKNLDYQKNILSIVKNFIPNSIFYTFQGQISILLISIFGNTQNIAEIGALSRFSMIFALVTPIMSSIAFPAFSRCQNQSLLKLRYWQIVLANILFGIVLIGISYFFSDQILWILGTKYSGLSSEFTLVVLLGTVGHIGGVMWGLCCAKGWIKNMWLEIPIKLSVQIILLLFMNLSNIKEVILFGIFSYVPSLILVAMIAYQNLRVKPA
ncbi:MAG: polysaccharide biosynthesis protein [Dolichospermum sp.]|nr:polysaccharide biosynthesis protein [Anabaena sp. 49628_E55]